MSTALHREEAVFNAARELKNPSERKAFLDQACQADAELRDAVEDLLAAEAQTERFFAEGREAVKRATETSTGMRMSRISGAGVDSLTREKPGAIIGRYKLLEAIGEGGCGAVYLAEQEQPVRRRVALKIIKLGMDTRNVIARFELERQSLAIMDHPNIARVLDAGATETGRPFFVMELVQGIKVTRYCDENHLGIQRRLELFVDICHAIQHAHQKGIVHRDIKPSNILVTLHDGQPVPKVIDFGIAKATETRLSEKTSFTPNEQFIGTPAYMSPEQAATTGLDIDTRSDIYSLGVLLYELLAGRTPFETKELLAMGLEEMRRTIREKEPLKPSARLGEGLGDLDWIVMKALEKDRGRRYQTANALAMDVQRYLANEPILARPPSRLYRFQKLVHRNKVVFAAGSAVAAALIIGLGTSTYLFFKERQAHRWAMGAEREQARLRLLAENREKITQAALLVTQENFEDADQLIQRIDFDRPTIDGASVLRSLGEWHALEERWKAAADRFTQLLRVNELDGWDVATLDYLDCGQALVDLGDTAAYERFRRDAIARYARTPNHAADRIVKISLLLPPKPETLAALQPLADATSRSFAEASDTSEGVFQAAWISVSLALYEYRRGDFAKAMEWSRRCLAYPEYNAPRTATARVILAMCCHQLEQDDEARSQLGQGRELIETKFKNGLERGSGVQGFWFDWCFARTLQREASDLITEKTASNSSQRAAK